MGLLNTETMSKEAAQVQAVGSCLRESRGKLVVLPQDGSGSYALWSGLIVCMSSRSKNVTTVYYLNGNSFDIKMSVADLATMICAASPTPDAAPPV